MSEDFAAINAHQTSEAFKEQQEAKAVEKDQRLTEKLTDAQQRAVIVPKLKERSLQLGYLTTEPAGVPLEHIEALVPKQCNEDYVTDDIVIRRGIANADVPTDGELIMPKPADDTNGMANIISTEEHMTIVNKIVKLPTSIAVTDMQHTVTNPNNGQTQIVPVTGLNRYLREDNQLTQRQLEVTSGLVDNTVFDGIDLEPEFETPGQSGIVGEEEEPEVPKKYGDFPEEVEIEVPSAPKLGEEATPDDIYYFDALIAADNTKKVKVTGSVNNVINFPGKWPNAKPTSADYSVERIVLGADLDLPKVSYYTIDPTLPVDPILEAACELAYTTRAIVTKTILWQGDGLQIKFKLDDWCSGLGYYKEYTGKADGKTYKLMLDVTNSATFEKSLPTKGTVSSLRANPRTNPAYWYLVKKQSNNNYQVLYRARCYPATVLQADLINNDFSDSAALNALSGASAVSNAMPRTGWSRSENQPVVNFSESFTYSTREYRHGVGDFDPGYNRLIFPGRKFALTDDTYTELTDCSVLVTAAMSPIEPCYAKQTYSDFTRWVGQSSVADAVQETQMTNLAKAFRNNSQYTPIVKWYDQANDAITGPKTASNYNSAGFGQWPATKMWLPQGMLTSNDYYKDYKALGATMMRAEDGVIKDRTKGEWLYTGFGGHHSSDNRAAHRYYTSWCGCVFTPTCWYTQWQEPEK